MGYKVPFVDPGANYLSIKDEIDSAISDCLSNGDLIYRDQLREFEARFAALIGTEYAVGLNSGYHALYFGLLGCGVGPGDEVITVAHTFVATISAIVHCGATPVLVDVRDDHEMDPAAVEDAITPDTKAILPVHLNGRMCEMDRIVEIAERHGLEVVEDAAQAIGASHRGRRAGGIGRVGCFSFYPFKVLGGFGDGGAITTDDPEVARLVGLLRFNGEDPEIGEYHYHGQTALLDNVQAAVLSVKLDHLPGWLSRRREVAERYRAGLGGIPGLGLPPFDGDGHHDVFQNLVVRAERRDELRAHLADRGVETLVHWPKPIWEHAGLGLVDPGLPETVRLCREVISLPMSAETRDEHVDTTVESIREFFA